MAEQEFEDAEMKKITTVELRVMRWTSCM